VEVRLGRFGAHDVEGSARFPRNIHGDAVSIVAGSFSGDSTLV
jgi:hypothetical protein